MMTFLGILTISLLTIILIAVSSAYKNQEKNIQIIYGIIVDNNKKLRSEISEISDLIEVYEDSKQNYESTKEQAEIDFVISDLKMKLDFYKSLLV